MSFPFSPKRFRPRAGLSFGAGAPNRRKTGASRSGNGRTSGADLRTSGAIALAKITRVCSARDDGCRPPRGATAALNRTGAGSDATKPKDGTARGKPRMPKLRGNHARPAPGRADPTSKPQLAQSSQPPTSLSARGPVWPGPPGRCARARNDAIASSCRASVHESPSTEE